MKNQVFVRVSVSFISFLLVALLAMPTFAFGDNQVLSTKANTPTNSSADHMPEAFKPGEIHNQWTDYFDFLPSNFFGVTQELVHLGNTTAVKPPTISNKAGDSKQNTAWERIWGKTYFDTMQEIVKQGWKTSKYAIIVNSGGFRDALSASSLAGKYSAPVLLVNGKKKTLPTQTQEEIKRLGVTNVIILGGTVAISEATEQAIQKLGVSVERVWGQKADDTAVEVAKRLGSIHSTICFVANNGGYRDALSASPYAYAKKAPIFFTRGSTISSNTLNAIKNGGFKRVIVLGGSKAINESIYKKVEALGIPTQRIWGRTAIDTSLEVAEWGCANGLAASAVGIANSGGFRDALCGASYCGRNSWPMLIVNKDDVNKITAYTTAAKLKLKKGFVYGGRFAVSEAIYDKLVDSTKSKWVTGAKTLSIPGIYDNVSKKFVGYFSVQADGSVSADDIGKKLRYSVVDLDHMKANKSHNDYSVKYTSMKQLNFANKDITRFDPAWTYSYSKNLHIFVTNEGKLLGGKYLINSKTYDIGYWDIHGANTVLEVVEFVRQHNLDSSSWFTRAELGEMGWPDPGCLAYLSIFDRGDLTGDDRPKYPSRPNYQNGWQYQGWYDEKVGVSTHYEFYKRTFGTDGYSPKDYGDVSAKYQIYEITSGSWK